MNQNQIVHLIRFILATAARDGLPHLWSIHLVKYLYIADYYHARFEGTTITGWQWKFWTYGPWCTDYMVAIGEAQNSGLVLSKKKPRPNPGGVDEGGNEYNVFYVDGDDTSDRTHDQMGRSLIPNIRARMALQGIITRYKLNTNPLLHFVYHQTEPMQGVVKGDFLNFNNLQRPSTTTAETSKSLKRKTIKRAKEILKRMNATPKSEYHPPKGLFDGDYFKFINELDGQDEVGIEDGTEAIAVLDDVAI